MTNSTTVPLRSAMKHASRPTTPTSSSALTSPNMSPQLSQVPLPSIQTPTVTTPITETPTINRTHSASPILDSYTHTLQHPPLPHHAASSPSYTHKVSFDTFENAAASMFSFTLQVKTEGYKRTRNTRVFLCASSADESGTEALEWCLESLVQDGDELIVFRGADEDVLEKDHNIVRDEARELMRTIQERGVEYDPERKLSLILEYIPGKVTDSIDRLISMYRPDSLIVGTRGRRFGVSLVQGLSVGLVQGLGVTGTTIGSISKYCLAHSPVPVIVVRPGRKLRKAAEKRRANPKRGRHFEAA